MPSGIIACRSLHREKMILLFAEPNVGSIRVHDIESSAMDTIRTSLLDVPTGRIGAIASKGGYISASLPVDLTLVLRVSNRAS